MRSRFLFVIGIFLLLMAVSGCSRPIVRPEPGNRNFAGVPQGTAGNISEQEAQVIQAELKTIYFEYDSFTLSPEAQSALQYNTEILKRVPYCAIVSEGHCDERGTAEYNLALGDRRSRAAVDYMVQMGVAPNRFSIVSYGSELPVDTAQNDAAWQKNRRVYLRVSR